MGEVHSDRTTMAHAIGDQFGKGAALAVLGDTHLSMGEARKVIGFQEKALC